MAQIIPLNNEGSRRINVALGDNLYFIETYYLPNIQRWVMDIYDNDSNPILVGIGLNVGVENLVKGKAIEFEGQAIRCVSIDGTENNTPDSLGTSCFVLYYPRGETPPALFEDKMLG